jgi:hypothetical protein
MAEKSANTASQRAAAVEAGERDERSETTSAGFSKDKGPVTQQTQVTTAEGLATVEGRKAQIERTDKRLEELNERNRAGHEKNMEREAKAAEHAKANTEHGPATGKEWNRNTPVVDEHGNKHWS